MLSGEGSDFHAHLKNSWTIDLFNGNTNGIGEVMSSDHNSVYRLNFRKSQHFFKLVNRCDCFNIDVKSHFSSKIFRKGNLGGSDKLSQSKRTLYHRGDNILSADDSGVEHIFD